MTPTLRMSVSEQHQSSSARFVAFELPASRSTTPLRYVRVSHEPIRTLLYSMASLLSVNQSMNFSATASFSDCCRCDLPRSTAA